MSSLKTSYWKLEVAPLTVLPFSKSVFSYASENDIATGSLVRISFAGRNLTGIVLSSQRSPVGPKPSWLKSITEKLSYPPLTKEQLSLAKRVSEETFTPLGKVLKHFVPKATKERDSLKKAINPTSAHPSKEDLLWAKKSLPLIIENQTSFVSLPFSQKGLWDLTTLLTKLQTPKGQILVLMPDIFAVVSLERILLQITSQENISTLYHTKSDGAYFTDWQKAASGQARFILATRHGAFAPFTKLTHILHIDPNDDGYKQWDMSPRYHTDVVAKTLVDTWKAKHVLLAALPLLTKEKKNAPSSPLPSIKNTLLINMREERYRKNWTGFSETLKEKMRETLETGKSVVLIVRQSGMESYSICSDCRSVFRCQNCQGILKLRSDETYSCNYCSYKSSLFPSCPSCKSIHFRSVGYGTEKLGREAKKLFPSYPVHITDKKHLSDHKKILDWLESQDFESPQIIVTTRNFLRFTPLISPHLAAIIDGESFLGIPGYKKDELFLEMLGQAHSIVDDTGTVLLQTLSPQNDLYQKIQTEEIKKIFTSLLEERTILHYPPIYRAFLITPRPKKKEARKYFDHLSKELNPLTESAQETFFYEGIQRTKSRSEPFILLRYLPPLAPKINELLTEFADTTLIDHDPLNFF